MVSVIDAVRGRDQDVIACLYAAYDTAVTPNFGGADLRVERRSVALRARPKERASRGSPWSNGQSAIVDAIRDEMKVDGWRRPNKARLRSPTVKAIEYPPRSLLPPSRPPNDPALTAAQ